MATSVKTIALCGIDGQIVDVQIHIGTGLVAFNIVGLPDGAVRESKERIRAAFSALGFSLPAKRITVNLAPADLAKVGSHYDLPIAVGILSALGAVPESVLQDALFMGELSLDGCLTPTAGVLPASIAAHTHGLKSIFCPKANAKEAAWADIQAFGVTDLKALMGHFKGDSALAPETATLIEEDSSNKLDFADVKGQKQARRAAEIAAAGGHNMLMCGPPGAGKSMIAKRIPSILPPLNSKEALEATMLYSVSGLLGKEGLVKQRPFREPHHSTSHVAMSGGGHKAKPGEMSLAHNGVLFLDELPEFQRQVLETLRQPIETGHITVARANAHVQYPARFQLIAAMNPSPCGYLGHPHIPCTSTPQQIQKYRAKISGPLLDRMDLYIELPVLCAQELTSQEKSESSAEILQRVLKARALQEARYKGKASCNAAAPDDLLQQHTQLCPKGEDMMKRAIEKFHLSGRGYFRTLRLARSIADLDASGTILPQHIAEALSYRYQPYKG